MANSLQDQLLGAGLIDKKKAKKISNSAKKDKHDKRKARESLDSEAKIKIQQEAKAKQERDRELNLQRKAEADKKAIFAQVVQLINHYKIGNRSGDTEYNFSDGKTIKKIYLSKDLFEKTSCGTLSVVRLGDGYELVPRPVAEKIREREPDVVVVDNYNKQASADSDSDSDDDYYADFEIPDDLMW